MSTPYGISTSIGSQSFQGYLNTRVSGPLNSRQYPNNLPYHNYGLLSGQRPTPPFFYPGQEPLNSQMNVNARVQYIRTNSVSKIEKTKQDNIGKLSTPLAFTSKSSQIRRPISSHTNYVAPMQGSLYIDRLKSISIGKSSLKVGLPLEEYIGSKSYDTSFRKRALQRARSGGCTAPKKKGSIYNYSLTQSGIGSWGSIPRQNY